MCDISKKLRRLNEEHDYVLMDDNDCREYLRKHFASEPDILKAFNQVKAGAYRADVFRYAWLWKEGGVYIDMGLRPLIPFDDMFDPTDELVVVHESPNYYPLWYNDRRVKPGLYQAFLACAKENEGMRAMLDLCVSNILNRRYGLTALYPTGPVCAWQALSELWGRPLPADGGFDESTKTRVLWHRKFVGIYETLESSTKPPIQMLIGAKRRAYYNSGRNIHNDYSALWMRRQALG